jgi:hypothetical protein
LSHELSPDKKIKNLSSVEDERDHSRYHLNSPLLAHSSGRSSGFRANGLTRAGLLPLQGFFGISAKRLRSADAVELFSQGLLLYQRSIKPTTFGVTPIELCLDYTNIRGSRQLKTGYWDE